MGGKRGYILDDAYIGIYRRRDTITPEHTRKLHPDAQEITLDKAVEIAVRDRRAAH